MHVMQFYSFINVVLCGEMQLKNERYITSKTWVENILNMVMLERSLIK